MTPQQMIQQQHAHQQAIHENEQFALAWLRATYEPCGTGKVDHQEVYKHYLNSCSTIGRRGVISPLHFPRCVRQVHYNIFLVYIFKWELFFVYYYKVHKITT